MSEVHHAVEVLVLTYTASLEFFERMMLSDARAAGARITVISDASMVNADPFAVRHAGARYLDARASCPGAAFHPKLVVIVGETEARVAIGSGNCTMAGWSSNAELWTYLRGDQDRGPTTFRQLSAFLRSLASGPVRLSPGAPEALTRVAELLDDLPADEPGPRLLHSLSESISNQLPVENATDELVMYAPFHDAKLVGLARLLERLRPETWTVYVDSETVVDGPLLQRFCDEHGGSIAWVADLSVVEGEEVYDPRYRHGKLVQWRKESRSWALTGSPNLSRPALVLAVPDGGNLELALLGEVSGDGSPIAGPAPVEGVSALRPPVRDDEQDFPAAVLLAAVWTRGQVTLLVDWGLPSPADIQRYDRADDGWTTISKAVAAVTEIELPVGAVEVSDAVRLHLEDGRTSNEVFVSSEERYLDNYTGPVGRVRTSIAEVADHGLGQELLDDLDDLVAEVARARTARGLRGRGSHGTPADHRAAASSGGLSMSDFLSTYDAILGRRMTEFALVLPQVPLAESEASDFDLEAAGAAERGEDGADDSSTSGQELNDTLGTYDRDERDRFRRFVERMVFASPRYPWIARGLVLRTLLHATEARLWDDERGLEMLVAALSTLNGGADESLAGEQSAAASLAAAALALLRVRVRNLEKTDESALRYLRAGEAVKPLLTHVDEVRLERIIRELPRQFRGSLDMEYALDAVQETLSPREGVRRAAHFFEQELHIETRVLSEQVLELTEPMEGPPDLLLIRALSLMKLAGPVYAIGADASGNPTVAAWHEPWLAVERIGALGAWGRAWRLVSRHGLTTLDTSELPRPTVTWDRGRRPDVLQPLLSSAPPGKGASTVQD